jgi:hypothetical protein
VDEFVFHDTKGTLWSWPHQNPIRWRDPSGHGPFVAVGGSGGLGLDTAVGAQGSTGVVFGGESLMSTYGSTGVASAGIGATVGIGAEAGYALDNGAMFGAGEEFTLSLFAWSLNVQFSDGKFNALSFAFGKSIGAPFGFFHFYTDTYAGPPLFDAISEEELNELELRDAWSSQKQVCKPK